MPNTAAHDTAATGLVFDPIWQWRYFRLALSQAHPVRAVSELTYIKTCQCPPSASLHRGLSRISTIIAVASTIIAVARLNYPIRLGERIRAHRQARSTTAPNTHYPCRRFLYRRRKSVALQ